MLPEHEQRFERIASEFLERSAGDYADFYDAGTSARPTVLTLTNGATRSAATHGKTEFA